MHLTVYSAKATLGAAAAAEAAETIRAAVAESGRARIIAATGASQFEFLAALVSIPDVPWGQVEMFHLDEYIGLPADHPASFRKYLRERLIEPARVGTVHLLDGEQRPARGVRARSAPSSPRPPSTSPSWVSARTGTWRSTIRPADFDTREPYLIVALDDACRRQQVGEGWFPSIESVPTQAISMSCRQILASRRSSASCPTRARPRRCERPWRGRSRHTCPASILQTHERRDAVPRRRVGVAAAEALMTAGRPLRHLRWYIGGLLFLSTVINYIDRQTLSVLAPYLKTEFRWTNTDFAWVDHRLPRGVRGRTDGRRARASIVLGTRRGLSLSVAVVLRRCDG